MRKEGREREGRREGERERDRERERDFVNTIVKVTDPTHSTILNAANEMKVCF